MRYSLALQKQKGNEVLINTLDLDIAKGFFSTDIEQIDAFTLNFTKEEIIASIERANIADGYLEGELIIQSLENKKDIKVAMTKDFVKDFEIGNYLYMIKDNKNLLSNFANKYMSIVNDENLKNRMKDALKNNIEEMYKLFEELPYINKREFIVYLINSID